MSQDFYSVLGVEKSASQSDIKKAYRSLSKEYHPDKNKGDKAAEDKFKRINEAYETLSDPKKKQMYDQFGTTGNGAGGPGGAGFGGFDFSGFQQAGGAGGFGDIFESFFGGAGGAGRGRKQTGEDIQVRIDVSLDEVLTGVQKTISLEKMTRCSSCDGKGSEEGSDLVTCSQCNGTGQVVRSAQSIFGTVQQTMVCPDCQGVGKKPEKPCKECSGEGRRRSKETVTIDIPAGIDDGQTLRIREQGDAGRQGSAAGDLYVHVAVAQDKRFQRHGADIHSVLSVHVRDVLLGAERSIDTLHGEVTLKIPAGTQPGQVLRIKAKGLPVLSSSKHGDHYVTIDVEIPKKLSRKEKELLEGWDA